MGIFDRLFGGRFTLPPPDETELSDTAILRELRSQNAEQRQALKALLDLLLARLPIEEGARLHRRILRKYASEGDPYTAIADGLLDHYRGQKLEHLVLLSVDWKGFDGFGHLAPFLVKGSGVTEPFSFVHDGASSMAQVLEALDSWLVPFGKRYLHMDSGSDNYEGVIVEASQLQRIEELACLAGLRVGLQAF